jgi:hypothetical protein
MALRSGLSPARMMAASPTPPARRSAIAALSLETSATGAAISLASEGVFDHGAPVWSAW